MKPVKSLSEFFTGCEWPEEMGIIRDILLETELDEGLKWGMPTYMINNKNVIGLGSFKNHFGIWFHQGVFLSDTKGVLVNAQEGKTKAMRHMKFTHKKDIKKKIIKQYVLEAIQNQKDGLEMKAVKAKTKTVAMPNELKVAFKKQKSLKAKYDRLTPGKQKETCQYIAEAKRQSTRDKRLEKVVELLKEGKSPMDMYR